MTRSTGGTLRAHSTSVQSNRFMLEYKPEVRHSGWLIKRGHSIRNFKRRLFCIIDHELVYHDSHDSTDVRGRLDLSKKSAVQCLLRSGFRFIQGSYQMILYALDVHDRDIWIKKLQEQGVEMLPACEQTTKLIEQNAGMDQSPILFSGWLRKRGRVVKSTKRRWFELSNTTLTYYSHPQGGTKKGSLEIAQARVSPLDTLKSGERHSFLVRTESRKLVLHADSQEERSLWIASLASVAESQASTGGVAADTRRHSLSQSMTGSEIGRRCVCSSPASEVTLDGSCRRCAASFISKTEDALLDVTREVQLILASPYSPEGSTSATFIKENSARWVANTVVREFMSGLMDYMSHTRMNELLMLCGSSTGATDPEDDVAALSVDDEAPPRNDPNDLFYERIQAIICEQIEERVFFSLYRTILENIGQQTRVESKLLIDKIDILRSKPQSFFAIGTDSVSPSDWASAAAQMRLIDTLSLPYMKRAQLVVACKEIYSVYHTEHPTNPPMNADDFIPAFIFVLIHSRLDDPVALKELITFFDLGGTQGEGAYFVTCLEIALEYIRSLLTASTVVLDGTKALGITFTRDAEKQVVVVHALATGGQAQRSRLVNVGNVLVAVNGLPVHEMELPEVEKLVTAGDGALELCLLPMEEYERKYGSMRHLDDDSDSSSDGQQAAITMLTFSG